jgi:hypothetical protein
MFSEPPVKHVPQCDDAPPIEGWAAHRGIRSCIPEPMSPASCSLTSPNPAYPPADTSTCELVEVGGYLDPAGNNFWGVEAFIGEDGRTYILGSDMDSGLWIFVD